MTQTNPSTVHVVNATWDYESLEPKRPDGSWSRPVTIPRVHHYDIVVGHGLLSSTDLDPLAELKVEFPRSWVITDRNVWSLHGERLMQVIDRSRWVAGVLILEPGEPTKSLDGWQQALDWAAAHKVQRRDLLLAFGGSVITDLVGFVASSYMRGVAYANLPTTLLAQVDGSMGGKVAVNTATAKNLVGAFHHPEAVMCDSRLLATLPRAEIANGLSEAIKTFTIESTEAFEFLERHVPACLDGDLDRLTHVVRLCASIKMHLLDPDPYEVDLRRVLNFGHTLGHPIETSHAYRDIRHGEAVAIGMSAAVRIGLARGITDTSFARRFLELLELTELPTSIDATTSDDVLGQLDVIRAIRGGALRFVIPADVGRFMILDDVDDSEIRACLVS